MTMNDNPQMRRLKFRAWHRGTRESDYAVGGFFERYHMEWNAEEIAWFERFMDEQDADIIGWAAELDPAWLQGDLEWLSGATGRRQLRPKGVVVVHMFNHQTHHRGQVHAMLTAAGEQTGDTDLPFVLPAPAA